MLDQIRRENLRALVEERFEGNRAAFCRATGKHPNLINLVLTDNPDLQRRPGERLCRSIEEALSLSAGYLDRKSAADSGARMSNIPIVQKLDDKADEWLTVYADNVQPIAKNAPLSKLVGFRVQTDHMAPTISPGDVAFINRAVSDIDAAGGIFLIEQDGAPLLARFRKTLQGWNVSFDNPAYPAELVTADFVQSQKVLGKAVSAMAITAL